MDFEREKRLDMHLEITPLIDVVLLLLIFFMLVSSFVKEPGIEISLPEASTALPCDNDVNIFVARDNQIYVEETKVALNDLKERLIKRLEGNRKRAVILKADEEIGYGLAVKVIDIIREAEVQNLVISTEQKNEG